MMLVVYQRFLKVLAYLSCPGPLGNQPLSTRFF